MTILMEVFFSPQKRITVTEEIGGSSKKRKLSDFLKSNHKEMQTGHNRYVIELDLHERSPQVDDKTMYRLGGSRICARFHSSTFVCLQHQCL